MAVVLTFPTVPPDEGAVLFVHDSNVWTNDDAGADVGGPHAGGRLVAGARRVFNAPTARDAGLPRGRGDGGPGAAPGRKPARRWP